MNSATLEYSFGIGSASQHAVFLTPLPGASHQAHVPSGATIS
jgi:hypothetical protein